MKNKYISHLVYFFKIKYIVLNKNYKTSLCDTVRTKKTGLRGIFIVNSKKASNSFKTLRSDFLGYINIIKKEIKIFSNLHRDKIYEILKIRSLLVI